MVPCILIRPALQSPSSCTTRCRQPLRGQASGGGRRKPPETVASPLESVCDHMLLYKDKNPQLFSQPEPAWCIELSDDYGILAHLGSVENI